MGEVKTFFDLIEDNRMEAVRHLLEIKGVRHPEALERVVNGAYVHTSARGVTRRYRVYSSSREYDRSGDRGKLYRVGGFIITESVEGGER